MKSKSFYLVIEPYVWIESNKSECLFYNTNNFKWIISTDPKVIDLAHLLLKDQNMYVTEIDYNLLKYKEVHNFLIKIKKFFMGSLHLNKNNTLKPIQIFPKFSINKDRILPSDDEKTINTYMREVSLYVNSDCDQNCNICSKVFNQIVNCSKVGLPKGEIKLDSIIEFLSNIKYLKPIVINILGGNIFKYTYIDELLNYSSKYFETNIYFCYKNFNDFKKRFQNCMSITLIISIYDLDDFSPLDEIVKFCLEFKLKFLLKFIIHNAADFQQFSEYILKHKDIDCLFEPIYMNNEKFFRKNIFINRRDILNSKVTLKEIFINFELNSNFFGKVIVLNNGEIFSNLNVESFGNIYHNKIHEYVIEEINNNHTWKLTRNKVIPCQTCIFKYLCPPISNYEFIFNRFNLCSV